MLEVPKDAVNVLLDTAEIAPIPPGEMQQALDLLLSEAEACVKVAMNE